MLFYNLTSHKHNSLNFVKRTTCKFIQDILLHLSTNMHTLGINLMARRYRLISSLCFIFLINSCKFVSDFPLTIDDVDTLTVYKEQQFQVKKDEEMKPAVVADSTITSEDSAAITQQSGPNSITLKPWTICAGVFKEKNNAKRMFEQLNHFQNTYIILRDSAYFVTIGSFNSRDSAQQFKRDKALTGTYIMKLRPCELVSLPEK